MNRGPRLARRSVALALLAALVAVPAAPLVLALDDTGPYCARDHCCCDRADDDERTCFRSVCGCGRGGGEPALVALGEAVLPLRVVVPRLEGRRATAPPGLPLPSGPDLVPPDHPPPPS